MANCTIPIEEVKVAKKGGMEVYGEKVACITGRLEKRKRKQGGD